MSQDYLHNHIHNLTKQISVSVERLKHKSSFVEDTNKDDLVDVDSSNNKNNNGGNRLDAYNYKLLGTSSSYQMADYNSSDESGFSDVDHAINTYNQVKTVSDEPKALIDFMHKYNKIFDFRV